MSFTVTLPSTSTSHLNPRRASLPFNSHTQFPIRFFSLKSPPLRFLLRPPQASKRVFNTNINSRLINNELLGDLNDDDEEGEEEEEEEDRSLDLLVRFTQNVFKKVSKRARKAVRSVLPISISTKLVAFSVNGVLLLAFLWVLKAFLEVVCTLGSVVFVSILLIRGIWSGITYLQESRYLQMNELDVDHHAWRGSQPVA